MYHYSPAVRTSLLLCTNRGLIISGYFTIASPTPFTCNPSAKDSRREFQQRLHYLNFQLCHYLNFVCLVSGLVYLVQCTRRIHNRVTFIIFQIHRLCRISDLYTVGFGRQYLAPLLLLPHLRSEPNQNVTWIVIPRGLLYTFNPYSNTPYSNTVNVLRLNVVHLLTHECVVLGFDNNP